MKTKFSVMLTRTTALAAVFGAAMAVAASAQADTVLKIESWRNDDADIWSDQIIPAFNKAHPDIKVEFTPTPPAGL